VRVICVSRLRRGLLAIIRISFLLMVLAFLWWRVAEILTLQRIFGNYVE